jgi:hypothetical protein
VQQQLISDCEQQNFPAAAVFKEKKHLALHRKLLQKGAF